MSGVRAATDRVPIEELADEFLERYRRQERPSITEYVSAHPELSDDIWDLFPTLIMLEKAGPQPGELASQLTHVHTDGDMPQQLGEYRILREIGRGGMGIVYEAEQLSLGRHVALKVLPAHGLLTSTVLTRFQNEARAAARLHHTNIVPVFGVGEDQGIHFYAMQFIQGHGLDDVLGELRQLRSSEKTGGVGESSRSPEPRARNPLTVEIAKSLQSGQIDLQGSQAREEIETSDPPEAIGAATCQEGSSDSICHSVDGSSVTSARTHGAYVRSIARMGIQVADGLAHAHSQGVFHRDIKPSNLLLDAHGVVWITDFGLAKQEGSDLTHSGDVVGTLRYLAPERFQGTSNAKTDIYGLGITLYELLTMQPAFTTSDRPRLIHEIAHIEPVSPRRLDPRVPRDLETIVLTAMAKEPERRYANATEMSSDLRRFLDDQPIAARRAWLIERLWRWCLRRPGLAAMSAALLLSLTIGLCGVTWQWSRAEQQKKNAEASLAVTHSEWVRAERNLEEAHHQRTIAESEADRAEANYLTARRAVDEFMTMVGQEELKNQPGMQRLRVKLLTRALEFYEGMLEPRADDFEGRLELADSYFRVAEIKRSIGVKSEARENYQKAVTLFDALVSEKPDCKKAILQLVFARIYVAVMQIDDLEFDLAQQQLDLARDLISQTLEANPDDPAVQRMMAVTLNNVAWYLSQAPTDDRENRYQQLLDLHDQALTILRRLSSEHPAVDQYRREIVHTLSNLTRRNFEVRRFDDARRFANEYLQDTLELHNRNPGSVYDLSRVAYAYELQGDVIRYAGSTAPEEIAQGLAYYQKSLEMIEPLTQANPLVVEYRKKYVGLFKKQSVLEARRHDYQRAWDEQRRSVELLESYQSQQPTDVYWMADLATAIGVLADLEIKLERDEDSLTSRIRAQELWRSVQEQPAAATRYRNRINDHLRQLMFELAIHGRTAEMYDLAIDRRQQCHNEPIALLNLSADLERSIRAASRGVELNEQAQSKLDECLQLAIELFEAAASTAPDQMAAWVARHPAMNDYAILTSLNETLREDPNKIDALFKRRAAYRRLGDSRRAAADWEQAMMLLDGTLQNTPTDVAALRLRAQLNDDVGRWDEAAADCETVLALRQDVSMKLLHARCRNRLGDAQAALADYAYVVRARPDRVECRLEQCRVAYESGQIDELQTFSEELLDLVVNDARRAYAGVWQLLRSNDVARFPELTLRLIQRAVELDSSAPHRKTLGGVYSQLGRHQDAIEILETFSSAPPGELSAAVEFWLAISYHHLGELTKADVAYRRAIRSWKSAPRISSDSERLLNSLWQEAKSLRIGRETELSRS